MTNKLAKCLVFIIYLASASLATAGNIGFTDVTDSAGLTHSGDSWGIAWGDFNNDGLPDLYDGNHRDRPAFFINQGDGTFVNRFVEIFSHNNLVDFVDTHGAQWADLDNDGYSDLIVQVGGNGGGLALKWNNTQILMNTNGKLYQRAEELGLANPQFRGRTPLAFDYNKDGLLDIQFTNITPGTGPRIFSQISDMKFQDVSTLVGLNIADTALYAMITDLNWDGTDEMIHGTKGSPIFNYTSPSFTNVSSLYGTALDVGEFDMAIGDFDGDLRPDIFRGGNLFGRTIFEQPQPDTLVFRYLWPKVTNSFEIGFTFRASGPVSFQMDGGWVRVDDYLIGATGWTPPIIDTINGPMVITLDPTNPANQGTYSYNFTDNAGNVVIGYDPVLDQWKVLFLHEDRGAGTEKPTLYGKITSTGAITILDKIGNYEPQYTIPSKVYTNTASGFLRLGNSVGVDQSVAGGIHVVTADFDNDGDLDIYASNSSPISNTPDFIYENQAGIFVKQLVKVDSLEGTGRNVIFADYDLDGYIDIYVTHGAESFPFNTGPHQLLKNTGSGNNWLQIDLEGINSNRDGIGARVRLVSNGVTQQRYQNGGMHKYGQNMQRIHFGLGSSTQADNIEIRWPSGIVQNIANIPANQVIRILEPVGTTTSFKGQPDIYQAPGVFLWQDSFDGPYHIRVHGGAQNQVYKVKVISDQIISNVVAFDTEPADILNIYSHGFEFYATTAQWIDGVDFNTIPGSRTMISIEGPNGTNPRLLFVGQDAHHVIPTGWIIPKSELPEFTGYNSGNTQGLTFGTIGTTPTKYKMRMTSKNFSHKYSLWLATTEPGILLEDTSLLEAGDQLTTTNNSFSIEGGITSPWEDGISLNAISGNNIALSFTLDNLFQQQFVNLFHTNGTRLPNAYWVDSPSPIGEPMDNSNLPLAKIWKEDGLNRWHIKFTAINDQHIYYTGTINSSEPLSIVDISTLEPADTINTSVPGSLSFDIRVFGNWNDEIIFDAGDTATLTFALNEPDSTQRIRIGDKNWHVESTPVVLQ